MQPWDPLQSCGLGLELGRCSIYSARRKLWDPAEFRGLGFDLDRCGTVRRELWDSAQSRYLSTCL